MSHCMKIQHVNFDCSALLFYIIPNYSILIHSILFCFPVIATLDYSSCARDIEGVVKRSPVIADGRCDCKAVWVDYDLTPTQVSHTTHYTAQTDALKDRNVPKDHGSKNVLRQWDDSKQDFPSHLKLNLKFFPSPLEVKCGVTYLTSVTSFTYGDSDFQYNFNFE